MLTLYADTEQVDEITTPPGDILLAPAACPVGEGAVLTWKG
jgi:hypothetical protein